MDTKSLRSYGFHGALGLLMGIGAGYIFYIFAVLNSVFSSQLIRVSFAYLIIYGLFGLYAGYIFGGQIKSKVISRTYAIAGIVGGLVTAFILISEFSNMNRLLDPLFISLVFAGPILGFPKIKNMVIMTISCSAGAALGYGVNTYTQDIVVYLKSVWTQGYLYALFIGIIFPMLAIGIAGASIAIGMYFTEGTSYTAKEIPRFLKIIRGVGIVLTFIMLFVSTVLFLEFNNYSDIIYIR
ncbi:MAG: hypothetical protein O8C61_08755 [Candidatus Methanoperedens sp.]|nr:hypothetical protein [Candidatus Methanoperedens sp.]